MVVVRVESCRVNDGFGLKDSQRATPSSFSDPRPRRGRQIFGGGPRAEQPSHPANAGLVQAPPTVVRGRGRVADSQCGCGRAEYTAVSQGQPGPSG